MEGIDLDLSFVFVSKGSYLFSVLLVHQSHAKAS